MKQLKSWRWKNLFSVSAWKKVSIFELGLEVAFFIFTLSVCLTFKWVDPTVYDEVGFIFVMLIVIAASLNLIFENLVKVCCAKKAYKVMYKNMPAYCFIYSEDGFYELQIVHKSKVYYKTNIEDFIEVCSDGKYQNIIFKKEFSKSWFAITINGIHELGQKIQTNVYLKPKDENKTKYAKLCILTSTGYQTILADYFVSNDNLYIPSTSLINAKPKDRTLFEYNNQANIRPDSYILIKVNSKYHFFGIYHKNDTNKEPYFKEMIINLATFREGLDTITLSYEDNEYKVVCKNEAKTTHLHEDLVVEITDNNNIKGKLRGLVGTTQVTIYEGKIYAIDFKNHYVIGDDFYFHS